MFTDDLRCALDTLPTGDIVVVQVTLVLKLERGILRMMSRRGSEDFMGLAPGEQLL